MRNLRQVISSIALLMAIGTLPAHTDEVEVTQQVNLKYAQRIKDLGDQIQLLSGKGLLTKDETAQFMERQSQLGKTQQSVKMGGYQKNATDDLEKSVTQLNADVFKASHKDNPVKPGQAQTEVNDPNLIPAYSDKNLQPGSGVVDKK
jgi:hypothetical protein